VAPPRSRVLRRVAKLIAEVGALLLPTPAVDLTVVTGWERRPDDEKMLAKIRAGRARAFFDESSSGTFVLFALAASICLAVDRSLFGSGPASSADDSGRDGCIWDAIEWACFCRGRWNVSGVVITSAGLNDAH